MFKNLLRATALGLTALALLAAPALAQDNGATAADSTGLSSVLGDAQQGPRQKGWALTYQGYWWTSANIPTNQFGVGYWVCPRDRVDLVLGGGYTFTPYRDPSTKLQYNDYNWTYTVGLSNRFVLLKGGQYALLHLVTDLQTTQYQYANQYVSGSGANAKVVENGSRSRYFLGGVGLVAQIYLPFAPKVSFDLGGLLNADYVVQDSWNGTAVTSSAGWSFGTASLTLSSGFNYDF